MFLPKIVLDTCVIESAVRSNRGASYRILETISGQYFEYGLSVAMLLEYEYRLARLVQSKDIKLSFEQADAILAALEFFATPVPIYFSIRPNLRDENDNHVFECCANFGADLLITHNQKDFHNTDLKPYRTAIMTPSEFLKEYIL
jgi:putative PIN family toxin of toxin-antitoxin system